MDDYYWTDWRFSGCQVSEVVEMTPPPRAGIGGKTGNVDTFDSTALTRLEGRMDNGEKDIAELRKAIDARKESQDRLEKQIIDDRVAIAQTLGEIKGGIKMLLVVGSVSGGLVMIGLAILGLVLTKR